MQCTASTSYSAVVIATPLELSNIRFEGIKLPFIPPRKYQSTISTFVRGRLRASYFNQQTAPKGDDALNSELRHNVLMHGHLRTVFVLEGLSLLIVLLATPA